MARRHRQEDIIGKLREAELVLAQRGDQCVAMLLRHRR